MKSEPTALRGQPLRGRPLPTHQGPGLVSGMHQPPPRQAQDGFICIPRAGLCLGRWAQPTNGSPPPRGPGIDWNETGTLPSAPGAESLPTGRAAWEAKQGSGARLLSVTQRGGTGGLVRLSMAPGSGTLAEPSPGGPPCPGYSDISSAFNISRDCLLLGATFWVITAVPPCPSLLGSCPSRQDEARLSLSPWSPPPPFHLAWLLNSSTFRRRGLQPHPFFLSFP